MAMLRLTITIRANDAGSRADNLLFNRIKSDFASINQAEKVSKTKIRRLFVSDLITLDGRPLRNPTQILQPGSTLVASIDPELFLQETDPGDTPIEFNNSHILYEDEWIIALNKPAGIPSEGTFVAHRDHAYAALLRFVSGRDGINNPYIVPHHRLDRDTSGVLLFSKSQEINGGLHTIFATHTIKKTYEALCSVHKKYEQTFRVENCLARVSPKSHAAKWGAVLEGGSPAITDFSVLASIAQVVHIKAEPLTGRTHQIRVHLSSVGLPILGDGLYGGQISLQNYTVPRIMLHAASLSFVHPITGENLLILAAPPIEFQNCLKIIKKTPDPFKNKA